MYCEIGGGEVGFEIALESSPREPGGGHWSIDSDLTSLAGPGVSGTEIETRNSRSYGQFSARCSGISGLLGRDSLRLGGPRYGSEFVAADGLEYALGIPIPH